MNKLAPIVLFVYNRPIHTRKTLEALAKNDLADQSILYVFCDGAKPNSSENALAQIASTRKVIREKQWCKEVKIIERVENWGLAKSIINGVTEIVNKYNKVIVLEDDLITSKTFLSFMNKALDLYEDEDKVMHISGYWFPVKNNEKLQSTFFYNVTSCWGWATWASSWATLNTDSVYLKNEISKIKNGPYHFDIEGSADHMQQLNHNILNKINTWGVKWYASVFINKGFCLHPNHSLVNNIGHDNSGENCNSNDKYTWAKLALSIEINDIQIKESKLSRKLMKKFYSEPFIPKMKNHIKSLIPKFVKNIIRSQHSKYEKLKSVPRYTEITIDFLDKKIQIPDSLSFVFLYNEIFEKEIYNFKSSNENPVIIDCGANIGISCIYFKQKFPNCELIAFEPDLSIFNYLQSNINSFNSTKTQLINKGLWNSEGTISFTEEGADGGRVSTLADNSTTQISITSLNNYLKNYSHIDFLKIDIEGAEYIVLKDIVPNLKKVERIFIEYHSFPEEPQCLNEILSILKEAGFRVNINTPGLESLQPFIKVNTYAGMDMQLNIYAFRS